MLPFICKYFFYYPAVLLKRQHVPRYLGELKESQWYDSRALEQIQLRKLALLLGHAKSNIPYYQKILKNIDTESVSSLRDLQQIPILTKELLKENFNQLLYPEAKGIVKKTTGGSTGNPVTIYKTGISDGAANAAYWRGYEWAGVKMCDRQARFWGIPHHKAARRMVRLTDLIVNRMRFSAFSYDETIMEDYYNKINCFQPEYLYGYVSMLEAFGKYLLKNNLKMKFQPISVIATSEVLTEPHRRLFENAFHCKVFNEYGCGEVGTIAHECERGAMHISAENLIVEILRDGKPVPEGQTGDIVVTELNNAAMPLIRYNLKDTGCLNPDFCSCGRGLPILGKVMGRAYDTICNKEGKAFHGEYFMYIFEELQNMGIRVAAFQVIQKDYENFVIKAVADEKLRNAMEDYIAVRVRNSYGSYAEFKFEYVSEVRREHSGKIRLIKSFSDC